MSYATRKVKICQTSIVDQSRWRVLSYKSNNASDYGIVKLKIRVSKPVTVGQ